MGKNSKELCLTCAWAVRQSPLVGPQYSPSCPSQERTENTDQLVLSLILPMKQRRPGPQHRFRPFVGLCISVLLTPSISGGAEVLLKGVLSHGSEGGAMGGELDGEKATQAGKVGEAQR